LRMRVPVGVGWGYRGGVGALSAGALQAG
jgi:hypothetical protein